MPRLSAWMVRAALVHLVAGFALGAALLSVRAGALPPVAWLLLPLHVDALLLGWTLQLAMGVAFWILPRFLVAAPGGAPPRHGPRGREAPAWAAFVLLNAGVLLVGASPLAGAPAGLAAAGRGAELLAAAAFALHAWPRVKAAAA